MKKLLHIFAALLLSASCVTVHAQVSITASSITDSFENPIQLAKLCFVPVNTALVASGFRAGSIQVVPNEVCGNVTNGVLQSGLHVAPSPAGHYYHIYMKQPFSNVILIDYGVTSITGSTWTLDGYDPAITIAAPTPLVGYGSPLPTSCVAPSEWTLSTTGALFACGPGGVWEPTVTFNGTPSPGQVLEWNGSAWSLAFPFSGGALFAYGDSHPSGYLLPSPTSEAFPYLVGQARGLSVTDLAVAGDAYMDLTNRYPFASPPPDSGITILNEGTNDVTYLCAGQGGGCNSLTTANGQFLTAAQAAWIIWDGTPQSTKVMGSAFSTTGTWSGLGSFGAIFTTQNGATATGSCTGTRCDLIVYVGDSTAVAASTYSVTVDGSPVTCPIGGGTTCGDQVVEHPNNGGYLSFIDIPMRGLSNGTHTVVVTSITAAGGVNIVGLIGTTTTSTKRLVAASYVARCAASSSAYANRNDTLVASVQALQAAEFATLIADGFNLVPVNYTTAPTTTGAYGTIATSWWNPNDATQTQSDGNHPNIPGHTYVANAYLNALQGH